eukprot:CAMPEP_0119271068 /NCGR_PEP_ID=MMETSP1329-20130426/7811_1 /TAXON_ID=114041 /ORGANISM="Genus nov. species nov., Strain RCC1024" /LENGTH=306 /DNA_ID=CAMNT_0007271109 /DNA_START=95 /DNA_END=1012 /DNA_ORIENTATION=-
MSELRQRKGVTSPVEKAKNDARAAMEARLEARLGRSGKKAPKPAAEAPAAAATKGAPAEDGGKVKDPARALPLWLQYGGIVALVVGRVALSYYKLTSQAAAPTPLVRVAPDAFEPPEASALAACAQALAGSAVTFTAAGVPEFRESAAECLVPFIDAMGPVRDLSANAFVLRVERGATDWMTAASTEESGLLPPLSVAVWSATPGEVEVAAKADVQPKTQWSPESIPEIETPCGDASDFDEGGPCYAFLDAGAAAATADDTRVRVRARENALVTIRGGASRRARGAEGVAVVLEQYRLPALLLGRT